MPHATAKGVSPTVGMEKSPEKHRKEQKSEKKRRRHDDVDGDRKPKRPKKVAQAAAPEPLGNNKLEHTPPVTEDAIIGSRQEGEAAVTSEGLSHEETAGSSRRTSHKHKELDKQSVAGAPESRLGETRENSKADKKEKKEKKKKKKKKKKHEGSDPAGLDADEATAASSEKPLKKRKHKSRDSHTDKKPKTQPVEAEPELLTLKTRKAHQPADAPADIEYPFFTAKASLWLPLFPSGFESPVSSLAEQHLAPLKNHFHNILGGVLLGYRDVAVGHQSKPSKDEEEEVGVSELTSIAEYAVSYGWLFFTAELFVPTYGAYMEGNLVLQSEGQVGVICWGKFNASIEAKRLPKTWKFIELGGDEQEFPEVAEEGMEEDDAELQNIEQMHKTGHWVDQRGKAVRGWLRFRIKGFDVGVVKGTGYMSIEGTMLTEAEEDELQEDEAEMERRQKLKLGGVVLRERRRRVPQASMTSLGPEEIEETSEEKKELYKGSRPQTPS
jgi:DNA-directed RNA polymerase I subunit RPA43